MLDLLRKSVSLTLKFFALGLFITILLNWFRPIAWAGFQRHLNRFYDIFLDPLRRYIKPIKLFPSAPVALDLAPLVLLLLIWLIIHPFLMWLLS